MNPGTVAVLNEAGYRTLNDIIDLERDDFLRLAGIAPQEADRIIAFLDELTTEDTAEVNNTAPTSVATVQLSNPCAVSRKNTSSL